MDARQRQVLQQEVQGHRTRLEELAESLRSIEDNIKQVDDMPQELVRKAGALRMEMRGRMAAVALGSAYLESDKS